MDSTQGTQSVAAGNAANDVVSDPIPGTTETTTGTTGSVSGEPTGQATGTTPAPKPKREAKPKTAYVSEDATMYDADGKLLRVPTDFKKSHKPLKQGDFASPATFLNFKADRLEAVAKSLRNKANIIGKFGSEKEQKAAQAIQKNVEKIGELRAQLAGMGYTDDKIREMLGIDVGALLAKSPEAGAPSAPVAADPKATSGKKK